MSFKTIVHKPDGGTTEIHYDIGALSNNTKKSERKEFLRVLATFLNYGEQYYSKKIRKNVLYSHPIENENTYVLFTHNIIAASLAKYKKTVVYLMFKVTAKNYRFRGKYGEMKKAKVIDKKGKVSDGLYCLKVEKRGIENPKDVGLLIDKIRAEAGFNYKVNKSRKNYNFEVPVFALHQSESKIDKDGAIKITGAHITSYQPMQLYDVNLWQLLKVGTHLITFSCFLYIILQMLKALTKMSKTGIVHGDINSGNVCISFSKKDNINIHFIDFGLSPKKGSRTTGTFAAPEYFYGPTKYTADPKDDVFALGILILEGFCYWLGRQKMFNEKYKKFYRVHAEKHCAAVRNNTFVQFVNDYNLDIIKKEFFNPLLECADIHNIPLNKRRRINLKLLDELKSVLLGMIEPIREDRIDALSAYSNLKTHMDIDSGKKSLLVLRKQINLNRTPRECKPLEQARWCLDSKQFSKAISYAKKALNNSDYYDIERRIKIIKLMVSIYNHMCQTIEDSNILQKMLVAYKKISVLGKNICSPHLTSEDKKNFLFFHTHLGIVCKLSGNYNLAIKYFSYVVGEGGKNSCMIIEEIKECRNLRS